MKKALIYLMFGLLASVLLTACGQAVEPPPTDSKLKVVATTSIVGDVVTQVGGDLIELSVLLPVGTDPHSFDPTPQDMSKVAEADLVFANGAGLEEFLEDLIASAGAENTVIYLSEGIDYLMFEDGNNHVEGGEGEPEGGEEHAGDEGGEHEPDHSGVDPHTWTDPNNVIVWVGNIEHALSEVDPGNADAYGANAQAYRTELEGLDAWIREQVALIPEARRKLVTDHTLFSYYADEYGFEQVGALIPGYSTLAQPSAQELAEIEDAIGAYGVKAIFVGNTVNPALAERVAEDTGVLLVFLYTGSLSEVGGEAGTYIEYMEYNTRAIVEALK